MLSALGVILPMSLPWEGEIPLFSFVTRALMLCFYLWLVYWNSTQFPSRCPVWDESLKNSKHGLHRLLQIYPQSTIKIWNFYIFLGIKVNKNVSVWVCLSLAFDADIVGLKWNIEITLFVSVCSKWVNWLKPHTMSQDIADSRANGVVSTNAPSWVLFNQALVAGWISGEENVRCICLKLV